LVHVVIHDSLKMQRLDGGSSCKLPKFIALVLVTSQTQKAVQWGVWRNLVILVMEPVGGLTSRLPITNMLLPRFESQWEVAVQCLHRRPLIPSFSRRRTASPTFVRGRGTCVSFDESATSQPL
jgi:hypothetical protein